MKKFEKIVPVVAAGVLAASIGNVAQAAEANLPEVDTNPAVPQDEEKQEGTQAMDTRVNGLTPVNEYEPDEDGAITTEYDANLSVDVNDDGEIEASSNGGLDITAIPQEPVIDEETGDVTTSTKYEVDGTIDAEVDGTPFEEDQNAVEGAVKDNTENGKFDTDGFKDAIKEQFGEDVTFTDTEDGFTFETSMTVDKQLTDAEKDTILAASGITRNEEGQYVNADGQVVTVAWGEDKSTVTNTTKWTVTIEKVEAKVTEKTDVKVDGTIYDKADEDEDDPAVVDSFIDMVLNATKLNGADVEKVEEGNKTTVTAGDRKYVITIEETELTADELANTSNEALVALLGEGFVLNEDGDIVTVEGGYKVDVVTDKLTGKTIVRKIEVIDLKAGMSEEITTKDDDQMTASPVEQAVVDAVRKAMEADKITDGEVSEIEVNGDTWTVTVTANGKTYTYTVTASSDESTKKWSASKVKEEGVAEGSTTTITGSAYVSGEKVVWTGTESDTTSSFIKVDEKGKATVGAKVDDVIDGETVTKVETIDGKIVVTTESSVKDDTTGVETITTKVYTFTTDVDLTAEEKAEFLKGQDAEGATVEGLSKITWDVETTTVTKVPNTGDNKTETTVNKDISASTGTLGATKNEADDTYTYVKGDQTITLSKDNDASTDTKNVYTYEDKTNNKVYTIEETQETLTAQDIEGLIRAEYELSEDIEVTIDLDKGTATYKADTSTVTVTFTGLTQTSVKLTVTETKNITESVSTDATEAAQKAAEDKVYEQAAKWIYDQRHQEGVDPSLVEILNDLGIDETKTPGEIKDILIKGNYIHQGAPDFTKFGYDDIIDYLTKVSKGKAPASSKLEDHLDLDLSSSLKVGDKTEDCYLIAGEWTIKASSSMTEIAAGRGDDISDKFGNTLSWDGSGTKPDGSKGYWEYRNKDQDGNTFKKYKYYSITGTVAYGQAKYVDSTAYDSAASAQSAAENNVGEGKEYAAYVIKKDSITVSEGKKDKQKTVYKVEYFTQDQLATMTAYGFFDAKSSTCGMSGFDLVLSGLELTEGGTTIRVEGAGQITYSIELAAKTTLGSSTTKGLHLDTVETSTPKTGTTDTTVKSTDSDQQINGAWTITQEKEVTQTVTVDGEETTEYLYEGTGTSSYDTYKTWVEGTMDTFESTGTQYGGSLDYSYETAPEGVEVSVKGETTADRDIEADVTTSVTTPGTPNPGPGTEPEPEPLPEPAPTPTPIPGDDIPDEPTPMVEAPAEEDIPDVPTPMVDAPAEEEIIDDIIPLADVPKTGDSSSLWLIGSLASALGMFLPFLRKKEEEEK